MCSMLLFYLAVVVASLASVPVMWCSPRGHLSQATYVRHHHKSCHSSSLRSALFLGVGGCGNILISTQVKQLS